MEKDIVKVPELPCAADTPCKFYNLQRGQAKEKQAGGVSLLHARGVAEGMASVPYVGGLSEGPSGEGVNFTVTLLCGPQS